MGDLQVMSASMDSDPDIALFREDLVILKRDVASLIEHIKGGATNNVQNATNQIERHVRSLRQEASRWFSCQSGASRGEPPSIGHFARIAILPLVRSSVRGNCARKR